jgi:hypothetical protein
MASFDSINFAIRPNKNIERKLIFEVLATISGSFDTASYRYIGLGSLWFQDFHPAHKLLGITDLFSIQHDPRFAARAHYNRPYTCVTVLEGQTSQVLPRLPLRTITER